MTITFLILYTYTLWLNGPHHNHNDGTVGETPPIKYANI